MSNPSKNSFSSPVIEEDLQRALCFFLNKVLLEQYPDAVIEKSLAGNFGFYSKVCFNAPPSSGFEKELERALLSEIKEGFSLEVIEMESGSAMAYFKQQGQKTAALDIREQNEPLTACLRKGSFIDLWSAKGAGKELLECDEGICFDEGGFAILFEPIAVTSKSINSKTAKGSKGAKSFCIEGLGAASKKDLKELIRLKKQQAKKSHEVGGQNYYKDFCLCALSDEGTKLYRRAAEALRKKAHDAGFEEWSIGARDSCSLSLNERIEVFVNKELVACLGSFKFSFCKAARPRAPFVSRGILGSPFATTFFVEGAFEKASLHKGIISSLQLIETILTMGGIENRKNLTSFAKGLHRDLENHLVDLGGFQKKKCKQSTRLFSLCFEARDSAGALWPIAEVRASPLSKGSKHWKIESHLFIDEIIALQIETHGPGALDSWIEKLN